MPRIVHNGRPLCDGDVVVIENVMNSLRVLMSTLPECALFAIHCAAAHCAGRGSGIPRRY